MKTRAAGAPNTAPAYALRSGHSGYAAETSHEAAIAVSEIARRKIGGANRDRTGDLLHAMQALSQLSYGP